MVENVPLQMRRSLSVDFSRSGAGNPQMGLPQHFPPRGLPVQQHNIMGQPFIELRHRAPENRVRLPFMPSNVTDHTSHSQRPLMVGGHNMAFVGNQGLRPLTPVIGQSHQGTVNHLQLSASVGNPNQQTHMPDNTAPVTHSGNSVTFNSTRPELLNPTLSCPAKEIQLPCSDGIEVKLDADDSAVKDLEDVEVKDLVDEDLNLNLDPEDGKVLDLETNYLHLDDFIESGNFDLIAYADPELNLEDKKDMFNEELDLSDPIVDEHEESSEFQKTSSENKRGCSKDESPPVRDLKEAEGSGPQLDNTQQESSGSLLAANCIKTEVKPGSVINQVHSICEPSVNDDGLGGTDCRADVPSMIEASSTAPSGSTNVLSSLLTKDNLESSQAGSAGSSYKSDLAQPSGGTEANSNMGMMLMQGQGRVSGINPLIVSGHRMDTSLGNPNMVSVNSHQLQVQGLEVSNGKQADPSLPMIGGQQPVPHAHPSLAQQMVFPPGSMGQQLHNIQQSQSNRPLLLDEQPLLLQDLLDKEREEQQQQRQMQAMIRQRSNDPFFPNVGK